MKIKNFLFLATLVILILTGCSNDNEPAVVENPNFPADGVIRVATNVESPATHAGMTIDNLNQLFLNIDGTGTIYNYYTQIQKTDASGNLTDNWNSYEPTTSTTYVPVTMLWQNKRTPIQVTAIARSGLFVSKEDFMNGFSTGVNNDQSEKEFGIQQSDLLYMSCTEINPANASNLTADGKINVILSHRFSKVNLTVVLGTEMSLPAVGSVTNPIAAMAVKGTNINATFKPATDELVLSGSTPTDVLPFALTAQYVPGDGTTKNAEAHYECILLPQAVAAGTFAVGITVGNKVYTWTSTDVAVTLERGKVHDLKLLVGKDFVTLGSHTIRPWTDGGTTDKETE